MERSAANDACSILVAIKSVPHYHRITSLLHSGMSVNNIALWEVVQKACNELLYSPLFSSWAYRQVPASKALHPFQVRHHVIDRKNPFLISSFIYSKRTTRIYFTGVFQSTRASLWACGMFWKAHGSIKQFSSSSSADKENVSANGCSSFIHIVILLCGSDGGNTCFSDIWANSEAAMWPLSLQDISISLTAQTYT